MQSLVNEAVAAGYAPNLEVLKAVYVDLLIQAINFYDDIAIKSTARSPAHILLLHENDLAALFIDDLVRRLRNDGWQIIPALTAYADPIANYQPKTGLLGQGRVAAMTHDFGWSVTSLKHRSEEQGYLRSEFKKLGLLP